MIKFLAGAAANANANAGTGNLFHCLHWGIVITKIVLHQD